MAMIPLLGSTGLGLMWGWLMGMLGSRTKRPLLTGLMLVGATLLLGAQVFLMVDWRALASFLAAAGFAWLFRALWQQQLRQRYRPPSAP